MIQELKDFSDDISMSLGIMKRNLMVKKNEIHRYTEELWEAVNYDHELGITYSPKLFREIFNNKDYFENLLMIFDNNDIGKVSVGYISNDDLCISKKLEYSKNDFMFLTKKLRAAGLMDCEDIDKKMELFEQYSFENMKTSNKKYTITINSREVSFPYSVLLDFIDGGYKNCDFGKKNEKIHGLPSREFIYLLQRFVYDKKILDSYELNPDTKDFVFKLGKNQILDVSAVNKVNETDDPFVSMIKLSPELTTTVLEKMPTHYNKLEKSIYIYIKLCKILSYDEEFYAYNQEGEITKKYEDINNISLVTPENPKVVCYTFNSIYGKMLNMIGINYCIQSSKLYISYGGGHESLEYTANNYYVSADSVESIIGSDLFNAKVNAELKGLKCLNTNAITKVNFKSILQEVYNHINKEDSYENVSFSSLLFEFKTLADKSPVITRYEKFKILNQQLEDLKLESKMLLLDKISYILKISKAIFDKEISMGQFSVSVIRETIDNTLRPVMIFSISPNNVTSCSNIQYYKYDSYGNFELINPMEIQNGFDTEKYSYIQEENRYPIPGIIYKSRKNSKVVSYNLNTKSSDLPIKTLY